LSIISIEFENTFLTSWWLVYLISLQSSIINSMCRLHSSKSADYPSPPCFFRISISFSMLTRSL